MMMKSLLHNSELRMNEILFENRNKAYGAYALRTESDRILTKSFFVGIGLLATISIVPLALSAFNNVETITKDVYKLPPQIHIHELPEKDPPVSVPQRVTLPPPSVRQFDSRVETPTRNADDSQIVKHIPDDAVAGVKNDFEAPVSTSINPPISTVTGPPNIVSTTPTIQPVESVDPNEIFGINDLAVSANFVGGIDDFRKKVMNKFDVVAFEGQDVLSTKVTFIVETDGTISNLKANGKDASFNAEAIRTIKGVKGKWLPGKNKKGQAVRSYFSFPITLKIDN